MSRKRYTYSQNERLKSAKAIEHIFESGKSLTVFPLRLVYSEMSFEEPVRVKAAVSVSKRNFKKAVDRNRIKRLVREAYRLNKTAFFNNMTTQYAFMFLYIGSEQVHFKAVNQAMMDLLNKFCNKEIKDKP